MPKCRSATTRAACRSRLRIRAQLGNQAAHRRDERVQIAGGHDAPAAASRYSGRSDAVADHHRRP
jgi:hypothetical protein